MSDVKYLKNSRVLVTGGAGFIGSNLVDYFLENGNMVVCLDNFSTGKRENLESALTHSSFSLIEGDIRNPETCVRACNEIDYVFHEAALGSVPRSIADPITTNDVNIGGFVNMMKAAADSGVKRFIYAASSSTYGNSPLLPKKEDNIGKPLSPYAITKYVNELYAEIFAELYGIQTIGLRYFNVFGRRQAPDGPYAAVIPKFATSLILHERPIINGDGSVSRDFTYIDNVIDINNKAALTDNPDALNKVYNVACGEKTTLFELFIMLRENLAHFDCAVNSLEPEFASPRKGDIPHSLADISRAKELLGYSVLKNVREGIADASEWYFKKFSNSTAQQIFPR